MSQIAAGRISRRVAWPGKAGASQAGAWQAPDARRRLQLVLAALWLLDAVLQYQSFMFSRAFGQMLAATAAGNPAWVAGPIRWNAALVEQHAVAANTLFATIQLAIAIGIAARPTVRIALAGSVAWSLAVWWLGEGLGGILNGTASPLNGAPGPVLIYALLAVLLWPASRDPAATAVASPATAGRTGATPSVAGATPFLAGQAVGVRAAKLIWLAFWGAMSWFAVQPGNLAPNGPHDLVADLAPGEPGWLASLVRSVAGLIAHRGVAVSVVLAVGCAVIAIGVFLPPALTRIVLAGTVVLAVVLCVGGQALGGVLTGAGTDPGSGPLLALLALLYWPGRADRPDWPDWPDWPARRAGRAEGAAA